MAVRTDITVNFLVSPRLVEVAAPSTEVTIQDLYDTLREIEDDIQNLDDDFLISAGGKEPLGGGVLVGVTAELNNAQLLFETRRIVLESGTITGSGSPAVGSPTLELGSPPLTGTIANDSSATFISNGVSRGDLIFNISDQSSSEILTADSETQITARGLDGGTTNVFQTGDLYVIYDVIQCNIAGGNLVAVDRVGVGSPLAEATPIDPVFTTFGTQVIRTGSSSATIVETGISGLTAAEAAQLATILTVAGDVWEEAAAAHNTNDTMGLLLNLLAASHGSPATTPLTVASIVAGVWNELVLGSPQPFPIGSAGGVLKLISETSGLTEAQIRAAVWDAPSRDYPFGSPMPGSPITMGAQLNLTTDKACDILTFTETLIKFQANRTVLDRTAFTLTIFDNDNVTPIRVFDLREFGVGPSITTITERLPVSGSPLTP